MAGHAGPAATGSLFSRRESGLFSTHSLQEGPLLPHKSPRDRQPPLHSLPNGQKDTDHCSLSPVPSQKGRWGCPSLPATKNGPAGPSRQRDLTHLPAGRPVSGTPVARMVPRQRTGARARPRPSPLRRVRPRHALCRSEHTRASTGPGPSPVATRTPAVTRVVVFYSVGNRKGEQRRRISRCPKRGGNAKKGRPARVRLRPPFCTTREEVACGRRPF